VVRLERRGRRPAVGRYGQSEIKPVADDAKGNLEMLLCAWVICRRKRAARTRLNEAHQKHR
jgi:hypothetical protein